MSLKKSCAKPAYYMNYNNLSIEMISGSVVRMFQQLRIIGNQACFKGVPSGLTQFLVTESPFKIMKNTFYFTLKAFSVLKIFKYLS